MCLYHSLYHNVNGIDYGIVKGLMKSDFSVRKTPLTSSGHNRGAQKAFEEREQ